MINKIAKDMWRIGGGTWDDTTPACSSEDDCNMYLIKAEQSLILVDTCWRKGKPVIQKNLQKAGFKPEEISDILLTHSHYDHCDSLSQWQSESCSILHMSAVGAEYIKNGDHRLIGYCIIGPDYVFDPFKINHRINDGEIFSIGSVMITAYALPGHTPDSMIFETEIEGEKIWITGDIVFGKDKVSGKLGGIGWINILWQSDLRVYKDSLEKMLGLPLPDILLPGHGYIVSGKDYVKEVLEASLLTIETMLKDPNTRHSGVIVST